MNSNSMNVDRRRKGEGPVGRADAPQRETGGGQGGGGLPSFGGNGPVFGGRPVRGGQIGGCGTVVVLLLLVGYYLLSGGQGINLGTSSDQTTLPTEASAPLQQPALPASNFTPPAPAAAGGPTWTVMLYEDADDEVLEHDIYLDLNEAERVGSSDNVHI